MKLGMFLVVIAVVMFMGTAQAGEGKKLLYFNPKPIAGFGVTFDHGSGDKATAHLGGGATLFSLDHGGLVGLLGSGYNLDFYDFQHHDAPIRDLAADSSGENPLGGTGTTGFFTIIPVRVGPF